MKTTLGILWATALGVAAALGQPAQEHYDAGCRALARGDATAAKREFRLSLLAEPLDASAHFLLALLLAREGDLEQAAVGFQQTLALDANHGAARYNLGTALLRRGELLAAARELEEAVILRPEHAASYNNLAKAYYLSGLPELAVASYREALRRDPGNAIARRSLGLLVAASAGGDQSRTIPATPILPAPAAAAPPSGGDRMPLPGAKAGPALPVAIIPEHPSPAAAAGADVQALRDLVGDLPHVTVEARGAQLVLSGWTSGAAERKVLDKVLVGRTGVLDLTTDDHGDPHRLLEVDATIFKIIGLDTQSAGHNFLRRVTVNASVADAAMASFSWMYSAAISYEVNIANVSEQRVAFLARPHLTTLSGTPAKFTAGGDIVYQVAGLNSGDIKPYPFGTTLEVTPTLLRTPGENGIPQVRVAVSAGRRTILPIADMDGVPEEGATVFENTSVTSEAVLGLNQTLILTGLNQREHRTRRAGVPVLKSIPVIKYLFSETITTTSDLAIIILLTPRDPAYWSAEYRQATAAFVEKRRAFVQASRGTEADMERFREKYPDWDHLAPNRFASHFFLMENSDAYRRASGVDLATEDLDFDLLGRRSKSRSAKP